MFVEQSVSETTPSQSYFTPVPNKPPIYGRIPNNLLQNRSLTPAELILLARRVTFGDAKAAYGLNFKHLAKERLVSAGLGRNAFEAAIAGLKRKGLLKRSQTGRRGSRGFRYAVDRLCLPDCQSGWTAVLRAWFDGSLTVNQLAAFLYLLAVGSKATRLDLAKRFGWSPDFVSRIIKALVAQGKVRKLKGYRLLAISNMPGAPTVLTKLSTKPGHIKPGHTRRTQTLTKHKLQASHYCLGRSKRTISKSTTALKTDLRSIKAADPGKWLASRLYRNPKGLEALKQQHGPWVIGLIGERAIGAAMDGLPSGSIKSWSYFNAAAQDEAQRLEMARLGLRPGDVPYWRQSWGIAENPS